MVRIVMSEREAVFANEPTANGVKMEEIGYVKEMKGESHCLGTASSRCLASAVLDECKNVRMGEVRKNDAKLCCNPTSWKVKPLRSKSYTSKDADMEADTYSWNIMAPAWLWPIF